MPTESIEVSARFPVTPDRLYAAWLDSQEHTRFTGDTARVDPLVGGRFTAWSGWITGETLVLEPERRIVQSWRTTEFPEEAEDSQIEVRFEAVTGGTRLTIVHTNIPEGQGHQYEDGWIDYYFEPMQRYFRRIAAILATPDGPGEAATTIPVRAAGARRKVAKVKAARARAGATKVARARAGATKVARARAGATKVARARAGATKKVARRAGAKKAVRTRVARARTKTRARKAVVARTAKRRVAKKAVRRRVVKAAARRGTRKAVRRSTRRR